MTMRAPSLASRAAVAAPRPEADPVITTHIPSLAIWFSSIYPRYDKGDLAYAYLTRIPNDGYRHADIGACHQRRFSPSWTEQSKHPACPVRLNRRRGTLWRRVRISLPRPPGGFLPTSPTP